MLTQRRMVRSHWDDDSFIRIL